MSSDRNEPNEPSRPPAPRGMLRGVAPGQRLCVRTVDEGEIHGWFAGLEGDTLVLSLSAVGDLTARIPVATILGVEGIRNRAREGALLGGFLAVVVAAVPWLWLVNALGGSESFAGLGLVLGLIALIPIALVAALGALIGTAFDAHEPLAA